MRQRVVPETIKAMQLTCERGGTRVFEGLSFDLSPKSALILHGPNGSGKSSLLRLVAGLSRPMAGDILRGDQSIFNDIDSHKAETRYIGHALGLKPILTLRDNLEIWAELLGASDVAKVVDRAISKVQLTQQADMAARVLSSGQQRRAALARLLLKPATLWILDEPTVGLDQNSMQVLAGLMAKHLEAGGMIMAATHQDLGLSGAQFLDLSQFAPRHADVIDWDDAWEGGI